MLYYAESKDRVSVPFTNELIARTLELLAEVRRLAHEGRIPPPLIDSPKCPRCSLVGICLPDEVNLLRATEVQQTLPGFVTDPALETAPRGLVPFRDDRLALYVQGLGHSVGLKGDVLEIRNRKDVVDRARLREVSQVSLFGNVQLSAQALRELATRDVTVLHLTYGGWLTAITTPPPHKNIESRRRQFKQPGIRNSLFTWREPLCRERFATRARSCGATRASLTAT